MKGQYKIKTQEELHRRYLSQRDEYFQLCWLYNLPPRDLTLALLENREITPGDRLHLIRLIISLLNIETCLGPEVLEDSLFFTHENSYSASLIFSAELQ